jgi:NADH-quinone oxidoreductase subunit M
MFFNDNILLLILLFPFFGILILLFVPACEEKLIKIIAFNSSCLSFIGSLFVWGSFQKSTSYFQFVYKHYWLFNFNLNFTIGVDGISLFFLLLTTLLIPLCILTSWNSVSFNSKEFFISFLALDFFLIGTFCVLDLLFFYIFFESVLIPMFLIIGIWGSRDRKILAAYYFFLYTLLGSVLMLLSILYI